MIALISFKIALSLIILLFVLFVVDSGIKKPLQPSPAWISIPGGFMVVLIPVLLVVAAICGVWGF